MSADQTACRMRAALAKARLAAIQENPTAVHHWMASAADDGRGSQVVTGADQGQFLARIAPLGASEFEREVARRLEEPLLWSALFPGALAVLDRLAAADRTYEVVALYPATSWSANPSGVATLAVVKEVQP